MPRKKSGYQQFPSGSVRPAKAAQTWNVAPPQGSDWFGLASHPVFFLCLGLIIVSVAVYSPVLLHSFVNFDDGRYIFENEFVKQGLQWKSIAWAFTTTAEGNWHPLTWLVHALDCQLFGLAPGGHHFVSLLFHALNSSLLFLALARITGKNGRSAIVAAMFALHPMNVESVAWAAELKNVLCTTFLFLGLAAYAWYSQRPTVRRYLYVALLFVLGLLAKPMVITFPFVLLLVDYWPLGRIRGWTQSSAVFPVQQQSLGRLALEKLPLCVLSLASSVVTYFAQQSFHNMMIDVSIPARLGNAIVSYAKYLWRGFWPFGLAPFYPHSLNALPIWQVLLAACVLVTVSAWVWLERARKRYLPVGWLWFLVTLVPVIGLVQVGRQSMADRYAYIPMIGVFVMAVWLLADLSEGLKANRGFRFAAAAAVLAALVVLSYRQISYWENGYTLWTHALQVTQDNALAEKNLGTELLRLSRIDEALPHLQRTIALDPGDLESYFDVAAALQYQGHDAEAMEGYSSLLQRTSNPVFLAPVYQNLAILYHKSGDAAKAQETYRLAQENFQKAKQLDPRALAAIDIAGDSARKRISE